MKKGLGLIRELLICCGAEGFRVYSWIMDLGLWRRVFRVLFMSYWFCCWVKGVLEMKWGVLSIGFKDQIRGAILLGKGVWCKGQELNMGPKFLELGRLGVLITSYPNKLVPGGSQKNWIMGWMDGRMDGWRTWANLRMLALRTNGWRDGWMDDMFCFFCCNFHRGCGAWEWARMWQQTNDGTTFIIYLMWQQTMEQHPSI